MTTLVDLKLHRVAGPERHLCEYQFVYAPRIGEIVEVPDYNLPETRYMVVQVAHYPKSNDEKQILGPSVLFYIDQPISPESS